MSDLIKSIQDGWRVEKGRSKRSTQETLGTSHNHQGKKVGNIVKPSFDNQSDLFLSHSKGTLTKTLQGSGFDIGDVDADDPDW